jgi:hypothetical protein
MDREPVAPHLVILAACSSILLFALLVEPTHGAESSLRIGGKALPNLCVMRQASGLPCPGCGLTRSLAAAAHADWRGSLSQHRVGILILFYLLLQVSARLAWLGLPRFRQTIARYCRSLDLGLVPILLLLVINWIPTLRDALA